MIEETAFLVYQVVVNVVSVGKFALILPYLCRTAWTGPLLYMNKYLFSALYSVATSYYHFFCVYCFMEK